MTCPDIQTCQVKVNHQRRSHTRYFIIEITYCCQGHLLKPPLPLQVQGGGNCANALTAAARLGLSPHILTKIGDDGLGDGIITELENDGIETSHILRAKGSPSPFTYIIVDREGRARPFGAG